MDDPTEVPPDEVPPLPEAPIALQIADLQERIKHLEQTVEALVKAGRSRPKVKPRAKTAKKPLAKKKAKRR